MALSSPGDECVVPRHAVYVYRGILPRARDESAFCASWVPPYVGWAALVWQDLAALSAWGRSSAEIPQGKAAQML